MLTTCSNYDLVLVEHHGALDPKMRRKLIDAFRARGDVNTMKTYVEERDAESIDHTRGELVAYLFPVVTGTCEFGRDLLVRRYDELMYAL